MSKQGVSYFFQCLTSFEAEKLSELDLSAEVLLAWNATVMSSSTSPNHAESRAYDSVANDSISRERDL